MPELFHVIAHIHTDFDEKFGIPRQSGLVKELSGSIVFEPEYRSRDAIKGIEGYDFLWLLWKFEGTRREHWSATVRPPRLGGNTPMGVFATRSPFRPNPIGLSSVHLDGVEDTKEGPILHVSGADLKDGTPIYDIKPYLAYTDSHAKARSGFADTGQGSGLTINCPQQLLAQLSEEKRAALIKVLQLDPRPAYHAAADRIYGMSFAGYNIRFQVSENVLTVISVEKKDGEGERL